MTFDQWWQTEYPKLADGQTSFKAALEAAYRAGHDEAEPRFPEDPLGAP